MPALDGAHESGLAADLVGESASTFQTQKQAGRENRACQPPQVQCSVPGFKISLETGKPARVTSPGRVIAARHALM